MHGVHVAVVTQFDSNFEVDHDAVAAQVRRLVDAGVDGIVACGTMGEANCISSIERGEVLRTVLNAVAGRVPVCAGISSRTAIEAAALAKDAELAGAQSLMSLPPLLYRAAPAELMQFFREVGSATDLPLMVYNNPEAAGVDMPPTLLAEVVSQTPSATAVKECSGDARRIAQLVADLPGTDIMVGGDDWALEGALAGAAGWISGVAVVAPDECVLLWQLALGGHLEQARSLYQRLLPLSRFDMTSKLVQYFKAGLDARGLQGGPCRPPRLPLADDEQAALLAAVALLDSDAQSA